MFVFLLTGLLLSIVWTAVRVFWHIMVSWVGVGLIILMMLWGNGKTDRPYVQDVSYTSAVINWAHGGSPYALRRYNVNWVALTVQSTYDHPYHPNVAVCTIQGPVYYSNMIGHGGSDGFISELEYKAEGGTYLGTRRLTVKLFPVGMVDFPIPRYQRWDMPVVPAATSKFFSPYAVPSPMQAEGLYVATTPRDRFLPDDKVTSCRFSETDLEAERTIAWVGPHADVSLEVLNDTQVEAAAVRAILEAAKRL